MRWGVRSNLWIFCVCAAAAGAAALGISSVAGASARPPVRLGQLPRLPAHASDVGSVAPGTRMHITIALKVRDPVALAAYARQVSSPGSSIYRMYLRPSQFAQRFGPSAGEIAAVMASLRAHGLTPGALSANHLSIRVSTTAARVEHAFSLSLRRMELSGGREAVVANAAPQIDASIASAVQAVIGLTSVTAPEPLIERPALARRAAGAPLTARLEPHVATGGPQPCAAASVAASQQGAYTADQIASAYRFSGLYGAGDEGQGQTIAIFELEPDDPNDIATYQACYGTSTSVSYVPVDGGAGSGPGAGEAALDIEDVIGLAPRANLLVYQGPNANRTTPGSGPYDLYNAIISQDRAQVITTSWGECEQLLGPGEAGAENTLFEEAAVQGESMVAATGDEGSADCNGDNGIPDGELAVDDPGSQPLVTGVGGTTLTSLGPPPSETVWNNGGTPASLVAQQGGAGGGGVSELWTMPGYQTGAPASLNVVQADSSGSSCGVASGYCREVPDVAADADPSAGYIVYYNGSGSAPGLPSGWQAVGGTSAAAPVWAALLADANASSGCGGSAVGFANPALYQAAADAYTSDFNDVTSGDNDLTGTNGGRYAAGPGYDMASGLGTPNAAALAAALCADALRVANPGRQTSTIGRSVSLQMTTTAPPGARITYSAAHLPAGLSISSSGRITGTPRSAGVSTVGVTALDQSLALRGVVFTWTVEGRPSVSNGSLTGVAARRPTLGLTLTAGRDAPALKSASIGLTSGLKFAARPRPVIVTSAGKRVKFSSRVVRGHLVLTLRATASRLRVTVSYAGITASGGLASHVRSHRARGVAVTVTVTDTSELTTTLTVSIKPSS